MAFTLRRPLNIVSTISVASKSAFKTVPSRAFHKSPSSNATNYILSKQTPLSAIKTPAKNAFQQSARRTYMGQPVAQPSNGNLMQKLLYGGAVFGGSILAINMVFNRETREDGGMPPFERAYLNDTFLHTGLGVGIIAVAARAMVNSGVVFRIMAANPWVVMIGGVGLSWAAMYGCRSTDPDNYIPKYAFWTAFNVTQAAFIAPLIFMAPPAILARAGLYTVAMMGSISFVGATAKQEKYLYIGGPLLAGLAVVIAASFAPMVLPATMLRTLSITEKVSLYGGLAVFGGFTLYDVQKILHHARLAERGLIKKDAVNESISLELDFLNIFVRMVQILMMQQGRRK